MPAISPSMQVESAKAANAPVFFIHLDVIGDPLWAWTGQRQVTFAVPSDPILATARTFIAAGDVGGVSGLSHNADGTVSEAVLQLGNADFTDQATYDFVNFVDQWSQRAAVIWFGYVDEASGLLIDAPVRLITGRMAHVATADGADPSIVVKVRQATSADGERRAGWTLADADQQAFYAGDRALEFVAQLASKELRFGTPDAVARGGGAAGGGQPEYRADLA